MSTKGDIRSFFFGAKPASAAPASGSSAGSGSSEAAPAASSKENGKDSGSAADGSASAAAAAAKAASPARAASPAPAPAPSSAARKGASPARRAAAAPAPAAPAALNMDDDDDDNVTLGALAAKRAASSTAAPAASPAAASSSSSSAVQVVDSDDEDMPVSSAAKRSQAAAQGVASTPGRSPARGGGGVGTKSPGSAARSSSKASKASASSTAKGKAAKGKAKRKGSDDEDDYMSDEDDDDEEVSLASESEEDDDDDDDFDDDDDDEDFGAKKKKKKKAPAKGKGGKAAAASKAAKSPARASTTKTVTVEDNDDEEEAAAAADAKTASAKKAGPPAKKLKLDSGAAASASTGSGSGAGRVLPWQRPAPAACDSATSGAPASASAASSATSAIASATSATTSGTFSAATDPAVKALASNQPRAAPGALANESIVITGVTTVMTRDRLAEWVVRYGGRVVGSVSGKTTLLVHGESLEDGREFHMGTKYREAQKQIAAGKKLRIMNEMEFFDFCENTLPPAQRTGAHLKLGTGGAVEVAPEPFKAASPLRTPAASTTVTPAKTTAAAAASGAAATSASSSRATPSGTLDPAMTDSQMSGSAGAGAGAGAGAAAASLSLSAAAAAPVSTTDGRLWVDKYRPTKVSALVGNSGSLSAVVQWLRDWHDVHIAKTKKAAFAPGAGGGWGAARTNPNAKALLISGPPGIGKTSTATILAREMGFDVLELNASDSRAAKVVKNILGAATGSGVVLDAAYSGAPVPSASSSSSSSDAAASQHKKRLVVMDEVDGMSSGDRGGNAELCKAIKATKVPIICIANDADSPKMRTLANYCYHVRLSKPMAQQVVPRLRQIAKLENVDVEDAALVHLVDASGGDIRAALNTLQMWAKTSSRITIRDELRMMGAASKDLSLRMDAATAATRMFEVGLSLMDRSDLFFIDYDMVPLNVAESYVGSADRATSIMPAQKMARIAAAAAAISDADLISDYVRGKQQWGLLPAQAMSMSRAALLCASASPPRVFFPTWLGKHSSRGKRGRLLAAMGMRMAGHISAGRESIRLDYLDPLRLRLFKPIMGKFNPTEQEERVKEVIGLLDEYSIAKSDMMESMTEVAFSVGPNATTSAAAGFPHFAESVEALVKAAFTRLYNKTPHRAQALAISEAAAASFTRSKRGGGGGRIQSEDGTAEDEEDEVEVIDGDGVDGADGAGEEEKDGSDVDEEAKARKEAEQFKAKSKGRGGAKAGSTRGKGKAAGGAGAGSRGGRGGGRGSRGGAGAGAGGGGRGAAKASAGQKRKRESDDDGDDGDEDIGFVVSDDEDDDF